MTADLRTWRLLDTGALRWGSTAECSLRGTSSTRISTARTGSAATRTARWSCSGARPEGEEKFGIDAAPLRAGFNGIAFPADGVVALAKDMDLAPRFSSDCCALVFRQFA